MSSGWGGAGLGRSQQGISDPISGGEVRDKFDKFKVRITFLIERFSFECQNQNQSFD